MTMQTTWQEEPMRKGGFLGQELKRSSIEV